MYTLRIAHTVTDYDNWKRTFDNDPLDRRGSGVHAMRVYRPVDDPFAVLIDLDLESREKAEALSVALLQLWAGPAATIVRDARVQLVEVTEARDL